MINGNDMSNDAETTEMSVEDYDDFVVWLREQDQNVQQGYQSAEQQGQQQTMRDYHQEWRRCRQ